MALDPLHPMPDPVAQVLKKGANALDRGLRGPEAELAAFRDFGLLTAPLPSSYGGQGWGLSPDGAFPMLRLLMEIGAVSLPLARLYEGHVTAIRLIHSNGTADQKAYVFGKVCGGTLLGVWGADGTDPVTLSDTVGGAALLSGRKIFASGIGQVSVAIVTAAGDAGGPQMILVGASDRARQSPEDWDVSAMVGSVSGGFDCSAIKITQSDWLGQAGAMFQEPDFHGGLWRLCACYAGAMNAIVDDLAKKKKSSPEPDGQLNNHRLGQAIICAQSATQWAEAACIAAENWPTSESDAIIAKVLLAREAIEGEAVRLFEITERLGGTSIHFRTSFIGRMTRDLRLYLRQAGLDDKLNYAVRLWLNGRC